MKLIDIKCNSCGTVSEINEVAGVDNSCPACGSTDVERKYSGVAFILKGPGFYKNDYVRKS